MKICKHELLLEKDFWKVEGIPQEICFCDFVLAIVNTKDISVHSIEKWLRLNEIEKSKNYLSKTAKINFAVSRAIINIVFKEVLKTSIEELEFKRDEMKKPYIENTEKIKFNISHTEGCVVVGFSKREIGVDIEKINPSFKYKDILKDCFTNNEITLIGEEVSTFFKYWTAKEAYLKCEGTGLIRDPKEIEVIYADQQTMRIKDNLKGKNKDLNSIKVFGKYFGAICISEDI